MKIAREQFFGSKTPYLKANDVRDGQIVTIDAFDARFKIGRDVKPALIFKGLDLPLPLNATNFDAVLTAFGDDTDKWIGGKMRVAIVMAPNPQDGGRVTPSIRLSAVTAKAAR